jgi:uncharacterized CHY-type Zn-finger protein
MRRKIHGHDVLGFSVDAETRCEHWHSELDIIAIKFKCCGEWYPCFECHTALAGHEPTVWSVNERAEPAVLCGACGHELTIEEYVSSGSQCTSCSSQFNPKCANHYHLYFAWSISSKLSIDL